MAWVQITQPEYHRLQAAGRLRLGETVSDPDGIKFGVPHVLTEWRDDDDQPVVRHQCWPRGHGVEVARPCLYERWAADQPAPVQAPIACPTCEGSRTVSYEIGDQFVPQPCPACCCLTCGEACDTPPQCARCFIDEDACYERRMDQ